MGRQIQKFGFDESPYERPTQDWICGWSAEGRPCQMGPDKNGRCNTTHECVPYKKGDRWQCSRPKYLGGKCEDGPLPDGTCCIPVLKCSPFCNLQVKRGAFIFWVLALISGLIVIFFTSSFRDAFFSPGSLTSKHSVIRNDCSVCHSAASEGPSHWLQNINKSNVGTTDSMLCLKCHNQLGRNLLAHGLKTEETEKLTEKARKKSYNGNTPFLLTIAKLGPDVPKGPNGELACSTCHHEHNGREHNLIEMTNQQCQMCHSRKFKEFSKDHRDFDDYSYSRRTRIMFDHISHQKKHFIESKKQFNCRECHTTDDSGANMLTNGFDTSCAGCHSDIFKGRKSIMVFNIPGLDVETLRERNIPIGEWPEEAEDGLTPFMTFLLSGDQQMANDIAELSKLDLLDLTDANKEELDIVYRYVWAIKGLFYDLRINGHLAFKSRFEKAVGREFRDNEIAGLVEQLSPETIKLAQMSWLPNLINEMNMHQKGEAVFPPKIEANIEVNEEDVKMAKIESGDTPGEINTESGYILEEDERMAKMESGDTLGDDNTESGYILEEDERMAKIESGEALSDDYPESGYILDEDNKSPVHISTDAVVITGTEDRKAAQVQVVTKVNAREWAYTGGWFLRDYDYSIHYLPVEHANKFLKAWLDVTALLQTQTENNADKSDVQRLLTKLTSSNAPGRCTKCHSVDDLRVNDLRVNEQKVNNKSTGQFQVNWHSYRPNSRDNSFTHYVHKPHLSQDNKEICTTCHVLNPDTNYSESFNDNNPHTFASNFAKMSRSHCTTCHSGNEVSQSCLTCHNYHVRKLIHDVFDKHITSSKSSSTKSAPQ